VEAVLQEGEAMLEGHQVTLLVHKIHLNCRGAASIVLYVVFS
jgi:hypothetical protein